jgi:adenylate cyclase
VRREEREREDFSRLASSKRVPASASVSLPPRPTRAPSLFSLNYHESPGGLEILERYLEVIMAISSKLDPADAAEEIIKQACVLLTCERATMFYVDKDELVLMIARGARNIRLPKGQGLAGYVASTGDTLNIDDAWKDARFDNTHDKRSGFRTKTVLATPVFDDEGEIAAVLQCINKVGGSFTFEDSVLIKNLAAHCSIVLRNAHLYSLHVRAEAKVSSLLEIVQMLHSDPNINSLIFTISHKAHTLVDADRCTLYLVDAARKQLVVMQGEVDIRIPLSAGIAGHVATTGETVNIPDCYADMRFNQAIDKKTGYRTNTMLCMPIFASKSKDEVVGVLQLINRQDESSFLPADEELLTTLLSIAGPLLKNSTLFSKHNKKGSK